MTDQDRQIFLELHSGLSREAPGSRASTLRALDLARPLADLPHVLDIGCGPGAQTLDLASALPKATIVALDAHQPYLADLDRRAAKAGSSDRIQTRQGDMGSLAFDPASFDLIWCEGAAYIVGVETALKAWARFLKPGGALALSDAVWLTDSPAPQAREFWAEYPDMGDIGTRRAQIAAAGYTLMGDFVLPAEDWWEGYYGPLERRIESLEAKYAGEAAARRALAETRTEIDTFRRFPDQYGYAFFVMTRP